MVSKNNLAKQMEERAKHVPHYGLRKLSVGVASVLLSTTLYLGITAHADTNVPVENNEGTPAQTTNKENNQQQAVLEAKSNTNNEAAKTTGVNSATVNNDSNATKPAFDVNNTVAKATNDATKQASDVNSQVASNAKPASNATNNAQTATLNVNGHQAALPASALRESKPVAQQAVKYEAGTDGVNDEFNHYVTRTINITNPDHSTQIEKQTVHFVRKDAQGNAGYYDKDGNLVYVNWMTTSNILPAYTLPHHNGYVAIDQARTAVVSPDGKQVVAQTVTADTLDSTVNVIFIYQQIANVQRIQVVYGTNILKDTYVTGTVGQTVTIPHGDLVPPEGYKLVNGETVPGNVTFDGTEKAPIVLHAEPIIVTIAADNSKTTSDIVPGTQNVHFPSGVTENDLKKTIYRTVTINKPDGSSTTRSQKFTFARSATFNAVTGDLHYSDWTDNGKHLWSAVNVPTIAGYEAKVSNNASEIIITPFNQDINVTISYVPAKQIITVNYIDPYTNEVMSTAEINDFKTGQTVTYSVAQMDRDLQNAQLQDAFELSKQQPLIYKIKTSDNQINVMLTGKLFHINHDVNITDNDLLPGYMPYPEGVSANDLNHTVKRVITVNKPDGTSTTENQSIDFSRGATINLGKYYDGLDAVTYDAWTPANQELPAYTAPEIKGYTADHSVAAKTVDADAKDLTDIITYTVNKQNGTITYEDEQGNQIKQTPLTGNAGESIPVNLNIPAGWEKIPGQTIPASVTATVDGIPSVVVRIRHHMITVKPSDLPNPGDTKPGNSNKKPGDGTSKTTIDYNSLHKTLARTVTIVNPYTGAKANVQKLQYEREAIIDDVTGNVTYHNWSANDGKNGFTEVDFPNIPGYNVNVTPGDHDAFVPSQDQINNWADPNIKATYMAKEQTGQITYVDVKGNTIGYTLLSGHTDKDVAINPVAPAGWHIVAGQNIPATIKATDNGIEGPTIIVEHTLITVKPNQLPNPGDKNPGNSNKKPGDGTSKNTIDYNDLHKTITRTITIHRPGQIATVNKQTIKYERTIIIDDVTGEITNKSDWTVASDSAQSTFSNVTYPSISGYTVHATAGNRGAFTPTQSQINSWTDPKIDVTYTANEQTGKISYVYQNQEISGTPLAGITGQTITITPQIPTNWKQVPGQTIPTSIIANADGIPTVTIEIEHDSIKVPSTNPKTPADKLPDGTNYPTGLTNDDLNETITRKITINEPGKTPQIINQTASFKRNATIDLVNHSVNYDNWTRVDNDWAEVDAPVVSGYTPSLSKVNAVDVTAGMHNTQAVINYSANAQSQLISYVNETGQQIKSTTLSGHTGDTVDTNIVAPEHYELVPGQALPKHVTLAASNPTIIIHVQAKKDPIMDTDKLNKTINRKITINEPGKTPRVIDQSAKFTRTGTVNEVTNQETYTDWALNDNGLNAITVPTVEGYTPSTSKIDAVTNPTVDTKLTDVVINYTANNQSQLVNYVDESGRQIKQDNLGGYTGETINVTVKVPDHYELVPGQSIPEHVTLTTSNPVITVNIQAKQDPITDTNKLNKTISRKITINEPGKTPQVINQSAKFTRTGKVNEVTDKESYTNWKLSGNGLNVVNAPVVDGYTPNVTKIDGIISPNVDTKLADATINYTANTQTQLINYVTEDGQQIKQDTLSGVTDETITIRQSAPTHYEIKPGQKIPAKVTLKSNNTPINIVVVAKTDPITDPAKLNKIITRKITINEPGKTPQVINQSAKFTRTGTINEVTGEENYTDWKLSENGLDTVNIPTIDGYTPNVAKIDGIANPTVDTKLTDITINYTANAQSQLINYVTEDGQIVAHNSIGGHTGDTVDITVTAPAHYEIKPGQTIPIHVTLKSNNPAINIVVVAKTETITNANKLNKEINRTITINVPDEEPQVIHQSAKFTRTGTVNEITGDESYTNWVLNENSLTAINAPAINGYTPNIATVGAITNPTVNAKLTNVTINYTANDQSQLVNYVTEDGTQVGQNTLSGKTGDTVTITTNAPAHYKIKPGQTIPNVVILTTSNPAISIVVVAKTDPITDANKLNKTISRKITINEPGKTPQVINQSAKFTRTGTVNEVTGEETYTNWKLGENTLDEVDTPIVEGYTPNVAKVDAINNPNVDTKLHDIVINYTATEGTAILEFVDYQGHVIKSQHLTGHAGEPVNFNTTVPTGWKLSDGSKLPSGLTFRLNQPINYRVEIEHDLVMLKPNNPKTPGDKMPDGKDYPAGVAKDDLNHIVVRTIVLHTPDGTTTTFKQTATITREAVIDQVDGTVTYLPWTTNHLDEYTVPALTGYTPSQDKVARVDITENSQNSLVNITYTANSETLTVLYQDLQGNVVKTDTINGHYGETTTLALNIPKGYKAIGKMPDKNYQFKDGGQSVTVKIEKSNSETGKPTESDKNITLPINYVDQETNKIVSHDLVNGKMGETKTLNFNIPDEYHLVGTLPDKDYKFTSYEPNAITILIAKNESKPTPKPQPTPEPQPKPKPTPEPQPTPQPTPTPKPAIQPQISGQVSENLPSGTIFAPTATNLSEKPSKGTQSSTRALPQTGNEKSATALLGALGLGLTGMFGFKKKKED